MRRTRRWRPYPVDESCKLYMPFYKFGAEQTKILDISTSHNDGTISGCVPLSYPMLIPIVSGTVTLANMRISAVNGGTTASGGAFVDFSAASVLTDYTDHLLVIKDSSNRVIQGIIKAAGTGETLTELITAADNRTFTTWASVNWAGYSGGVVADGTGKLQVTMDSSGNCGAQLAKARFNGGLGSIIGELYYFSFDVWQGTTTKTAFFLETGGFASLPITISGVQTTFTGYGTATSSDLLYIYNKSSDSGTFFVDNASLKKVLTPSATGVTIVNSKGGVTYNWLGKDASFNYNDSSGYTYIIYSVPSYQGLGWFADGTDDRIVHSSLNLGTTHTLHYWLLYQGISGVIHGGAATYHGMRLSPTACGYNVGTTEVTATHSASYGIPVLFSIDRNGTSVDFYKNGVQIGTTQTLGANTAQVLTDLFRYSDGTSYWNGIIFEAVNINTNKGSQEIRNFFEMTRSKYGV